MRFAKPADVVGAEGVAARAAAQRGGVVDFARGFVRGADRLKFGDENEPTAEDVLIRGGVETREVLESRHVWGGRRVSGKTRTRWDKKFSWADGWAGSLKLHPPRLKHRCPFGKRD